MLAGRFELKENAPVRVPGTQVGYPQIPLDMASDGLSNGTVSFPSDSFFIDPHTAMFEDWINSHTAIEHLTLLSR